MNRILHIDDNSDFRDAFETAIARKAYQVHSCADSNAVAKLIPLRDYNVLVTDSSGFKYCESIGVLVNSVFVAVLSSRSNPKPKFKANVILSKTDPTWLEKLDTALNAWFAERTKKKGLDQGDPKVHHPQRMEAFPHQIADQSDPLSALDEKALQVYTDKVIVISVNRNRIIFAASTLLEAKELVKNSSFANELCRYVPGPTSVPYTLQEIEQD